MSETNIENADTGIIIEITKPFDIQKIEETEKDNITVIVSDTIKNTVKASDLTDGTFLKFISDNFIFNQAIPSSTWHITHNLDKYPSVTIVDSSNKVVIGAIQYISTSAIDVTFTGEFAGKAYLS